MTNSLTTDRRVAKSKAALKQALLGWMSRKEFGEITITDIVESAELNRGTFYKHYSCKEQLLDDILSDVLSDLIRAYRYPYANMKNFDVQMLRPSNIKIFDHVQNYAAVYTLMVKTNSLPEFKNRIYETLKHLYLADMTELSPNPAIDKEVMACYQANAVLGIMTEWVQNNFKHNPAYLAEQLVELTRLNRSQESYLSNLD
ncbi:TetR/AcrR family transcriptional regulator [Cohnella fermenti]|nr:TetR/AcrR family transcriptional regulator [Cohnella fermenti]